MKKNYAKVIGVLVLVMMLVTMFASCSSQKSEVRVEEKNQEFLNYEILSISASAYHVSSVGHKTCIVVVAIDLNNEVHTWSFYDSEIRIITDGKPHLLYEENNYGARNTYLCITREDLNTYLH